MRIRVAVLVAAIAVSAGACTDSPVAFEDIPGVWEAISVNGSPVPGFVTIKVGMEEEARSARYELYTFLDDGTCRVVLNYSQGEISHNLCRWDRHEDPAAITIVLGDGDPELFLSGIVNGSLLTVSTPNPGGDPNIRVYRKQ
jgi:hypothetical protein